eukprot:515553-Prorocentrum_minimum.AAC.3
MHRFSLNISLAKLGSAYGTSSALARAETPRSPMAFPARSSSVRVGTAAPASAFATLARPASPTCRRVSVKRSEPREPREPDLKGSRGEVAVKCRILECRKGAHLVALEEQRAQQCGGGGARLT